MALILSLGVGLVMFGGSILLQTRIVAAQGGVRIPFFAGDTDAASAPAAAPEPPGVGVSYEAPVRLVIPAIGVDANIQSVGRWWRDPSEIGIPTNFTDVAWYSGGPLPGEPGSAVIDGHYDGKDVQQAVFYNLGKLKKGDTVEVVNKNGTTLQFAVVAVKLYDYNATTTEIFDSDPSKTRLNLITCGGDWIKSQEQYNQRVVVFTELED